MDSVLLSTLAGSVVSFLLKYVPNFSEWYDSQKGTYKYLIDLFVLAAVVVSVYFLNCYGYYDFKIVCDTEGVRQLAINFLVALGANNMTYNVIKRL